MNDQQPRRTELRIELGDPGRLGELCDFFASVQAVARIDGNAVVVSLPGRPGAADDRHLRAYLRTWLALAEARGDQLRAKSAARSRRHQTATARRASAGRLVLRPYAASLHR